MTDPDRFYKSVRNFLMGLVVITGGLVVLGFAIGGEAVAMSLGCLVWTAIGVAMLLDWTSKNRRRK